MVQATVVVERREVVADRDDVAAGRGLQVPGEAHLVVVGVGRAGQDEAVAGELLLGGADHGVDLAGTGARHHGVEVGRVVGERRGDERATALRDALVPGADVVVDELVDGVGHGQQLAVCAAARR